MIERESEIQPEVREKKEYSFEEGVEEAIKRINELLEKLEYVVISISGAPDVGKTTFEGNIGRDLMSRNIPFVIKSNVGDIDIYTKQKVDREKKHRDNEKCVIIFGAGFYPLQKGTEGKITMFKKSIDEDLLLSASKVGLPLSQVDLRIHLYRSDKPFSTNESVNQFADIIINNSHAKDDEGKMRMK